MKYIRFLENGDHTGVAHDPIDFPIFLSISNCCRESQRGHCSALTQIWCNSLMSRRSGELEADQAFRDRTSGASP
ncbi:hypothetical protein, partial [Rhizobium rhizogenes]|uniref:hypothetical protein n=1 Tax=Rhizobium rhizogenes TaxID=359 RepID=UPI001AED5204